MPALRLVPPVPDLDAPHTESEPPEHDLDALVTSHLPLVGHITREVLGRLPMHVERADLFSAGSMALVSASRSWEPARGVPFARYAAIRVRGALKDELRTMDWASRGVRARGRAVAETREALRSTLGRTPTDAEVVGASGMTPAEVRTSDADVARANVLSIHTPSGQDGVAALACDRPRPEDVVLERETLGALDRAVEELPVRLRRVVRGYFFEERPMAELAAELGVTESRISQLRAEAVRALREVMATAETHREPAAPTTFAPRVIAAEQAYIAVGRARRGALERLHSTRRSIDDAPRIRAVGGA